MLVPSLKYENQGEGGERQKCLNQNILRKNCVKILNNSQRFIKRNQNYSRLEFLKTGLERGHESL